MEFNGKEFIANESESVLDCLLRHGEQVNYSCMAGNCQSCLLRALEGKPDSQAVAGLKDTQILNGYFLSCQQIASSMNKVAEIDEHAIYSHARVVEKFLYSDAVCRLRLEPTSNLYYHPGQFINIRSGLGDVRSYSLASVPSQEPYLELHIRRYDSGKVSPWVFDKLKVDELIEFQGPIGECFYTGKTKTSRIYLIGTGTGAAPLIGIARDALYSGHSNELHFYHGASTSDGLYLHQELTFLQDKFEHFSYHPCVSGSVDEKLSSDIRRGRCNDIALQDIQINADDQLFLCGQPDMVKETRKRAFLAGISSKNIYADPFEYGG